jgi:hypothetical protein
MCDEIYLDHLLESDVPEGQAKTLLDLVVGDDVVRHEAEHAQNQYLGRFVPANGVGQAVSKSPPLLRGWHRGNERQQSINGLGADLTRNLAAVGYVTY